MSARFMSFGQGVACRNWCWMSNICCLFVFNWGGIKPWRSPIKGVRPTQMFDIVIFFNCGQVLQFGAYFRYYKGALTQKISFVVVCTTFRSDFHVSWKNQKKHSTLNLSFDALSKWHDPHIQGQKIIFNYQNF